MGTSKIKSGRGYRLKMLETTWIGDLDQRS